MSRVCQTFDLEILSNGKELVDLGGVDLDLAKVDEVHEEVEQPAVHPPHEDQRLGEVVLLENRLKDGTAGG